MAKDEMELITEDKWDEDIWGVEHEDIDHKYRVPRLVFYFGEKVCSAPADWSGKANESRITG
jgi:hypothetical protein